MDFFYENGGLLIAHIKQFVSRNKQLIYYSAKV